MGSAVSSSLERAQFATIARLLSCLVTESLVPAFYQSVEYPGVSGLAIILKSEALVDLEILSSDDILALVPLHHSPILKHEENNFLGIPISLLDPLDMIALAFETGPGVYVDNVGLISRAEMPLKL